MCVDMYAAICKAAQQFANQHNSLLTNTQRVYSTALHAYPMAAGKAPRLLSCFVVWSKVHAMVSLWD